MSGGVQKLIDQYETIQRFMADGQLDVAEQLLRSVEAEGESNAMFWSVSGELLFRQSKIELAVDAMKRAVALEPPNAAIFTNAGRVLSASGRLLESLPCFYRALQLNPQRPEVQQDLERSLLGVAGAFEQQDQYAEAYRYHQAAVQLNPESVDAWRGLARHAAVQGNIAQAIDHYRQALQRQLQVPLLAAPESPPSRLADPAIETLMWRTLAQLAAAGVHAFPTSGTLLGLVREGRLLPFDKDLDFGLPFDEMSRASDCLLQRGWQEDSRAMRLMTPLSFVHIETGVTLDLCGFLNDTTHGVVIGGFWQRGQPWSHQRITEYPAPLQLIQQQRPQGMVWALQNPVPWLVALYGEAWQEPDPDFDSVIAAHNLRGFSALTQCYGFMRIVQYIRQGRLPKALCTTRHCLRHLPQDALLQEAARVLETSLSQGRCGRILG